MKIINSIAEILRTGLETDFVTPEQFIEKVGRTCYKSEDKITNDSAAKFVTNLIKRGHEAMIEHWTLIFKTDAYWYDEIKADWTTLLHNSDIKLAKQFRPYLRFTDCYVDGDYRFVISGNMRAWRDFAEACVEGFGYVPRYLHGLIRNYPLFFPEYQDHVPAVIVNDILIPITASELVGKVEHGVHHDVTVKFICDRGVSHEIVRHRTASFAQESTRYCNYSGEKYGREITVIKPAQFTDDFESTNVQGYVVWLSACEAAERYYFQMLETGCTPQEARSVLPNSLKTEVIMTANLYCWDHFFELRCATDAHPDIQVVAKMVKAEFDRFEET